MSLGSGDSGGGLESFFDYLFVYTIRRMRPFFWKIYYI